MVVSLCINHRIVEPNDPYKKLVQGGMMLSNYAKRYNSGKGIIYVKLLQENLNLNVA